MSTHGAVGSLTGRWQNHFLKDLYLTEGVAVVVGTSAVAGDGLFSYFNSATSSGPRSKWAYVINEFLIKFFLSNEFIFIYA